MENEWDLDAKRLKMWKKFNKGLKLNSTDNEIMDLIDEILRTNPQRMQKFCAMITSDILTVLRQYHPLPVVYVFGSTVIGTALLGKIR